MTTLYFLFKSTKAVWELSPKAFRPKVSDFETPLLRSLDQLQKHLQESWPVYETAAAGKLGKTTEKKVFICFFKTIIVFSAGGSLPVGMAVRSLFTALSFLGTEGKRRATAIHRTTEAAE